MMRRSEEVSSSLETVLLIVGKSYTYYEQLACLLSWLPEML
jgi:hypothetical protein